MLNIKTVDILHGVDSRTGNLKQVINCGIADTIQK